MHSCCPIITEKWVIAAKKQVNHYSEKNDQSLNVIRYTYCHHITVHIFIACICRYANACTRLLCYTRSTNLQCSPHTICFSFWHSPDTVNKRNNMLFFSFSTIFNNMWLECVLIRCQFSVFLLQMRTRFADMFICHPNRRVHVFSLTLLLLSLFHNLFGI